MAMGSVSPDGGNEKPEDDHSDQASTQIFQDPRSSDFAEGQRNHRQSEKDHEDGDRDMRG